MKDDARIPCTFNLQKQFWTSLAENLWWFFFSFLVRKGRCSWNVTRSDIFAHKRSTTKYYFLASPCVITVMMLCFGCSTLPNLGGGLWDGCSEKEVSYIHRTIFGTYIGFPIVTTASATTWGWTKPAEEVSLPSVCKAFSSKALKSAPIWFTCSAFEGRSSRG